MQVPTITPSSSFSSASSASSNLQLPSSGVALLSHLGVIEVSGEDNLRFLNGQLSNDLNQLAPNQARLAAFCSAKGRMQASFVAVKRENGDVLLICSHDVLAPTLKRLSMFVMRAKAKLRDTTSDFSLYGLLGESASAFDAEGVLPWSAAHAGDASVVQLYPAQGLARQLWMAPLGTPAPAGPALPLADWLCSEALSGVATVTAAVVEAFVPQMLNYESVGGVSFKKGCYPGQEVVARSQFRGTLKRRAYVAHMPAIANDALVQSGQELFSSEDPEQPCGLVVQAARSSQGAWLAIVSMQTSAAESGELRLSGPGGAPVTLLPLPYALLEDI